MRTLFHHPLCPFSRKIRLVLAEKDIRFDSVEERFWERRREFLEINPLGEVPALQEVNGQVLTDAAAIAEYFDEIVANPALIGPTPLARAEVRRLTGWFDRRFHAEVSGPLLTEKVWKRIGNGGEPDTGAVRAGCSNIHYHLDYIAWLCERRSWLAGEFLSLADLTAAAHLSALDYIGNVPWDQHEGAKDWYARIKSRPSFRALLADRVSSMPPPKHYTDLDF